MHRCVSPAPRPSVGCGPPRIVWHAIAGLHLRGAAAGASSGKAAVLMQSEPRQSLDAAVRVALTTTADKAQAERIARALVEQRLAACVNIVEGIRSIYRWQDAVESATECLLIIKTAESRIAEVRTMLQELHSYELPEFLVLEAADGSEAYLAWIAASVR